MIEKLLNRVVEVLRDAFTGVLADPASHIVEGPALDPAAAALPFIVVSMGPAAIDTRAKDSSSSEARPQDFTQELTIDAANPLGPYQLSKTPLRTSALCQVVFAKGTPDEHRRLILEGQDFQIDYQNATLSLARSLPEASSVLARYSFAGIFTTKDFSQEFHVTVFAADYSAEKLASLTLSIVLSSRDDLLTFYNVTSPTTYTAGPFVSTHTLSQLQAVGGIPAMVATGVRLDCTFRVVGQMKLTREIADGFALIERIRSPGRSGSPVDIEVGLG